MRNVGDMLESELDAIFLLKFMVAIGPTTHHGLFMVSKMIFLR